MMKNPIDDEKDEFRVRRGGSWDGNAWYTRVSSRYSRGPANRSYDLGFRIVRNNPKDKK
jgi:formylglycine-generating enzyme required for sulfatase activity